MRLLMLVVAACVWLRCADLVAQPVPGVIENSIGITLVLLQPGSFTMGEPGGDDLLMSPHRPHQVTLTTPFYMGVYEVTNAQWKKVMGWVPKMWNDDDHPVVQVSWEDATEFCRTLSAMPEEKEAGRVYRLPTEAEWEYACRAGTTTKWSFGNDEARLEKYGWFEANSGGSSHRIGTKKPNAWGLYDMHGNVWELCSDRTDAVIDGGTDAAIDPQGPSSGGSHVIRGGGWESEAKTCRSARRGGVTPSFREFSILGFRLAMTPPGIQPADLKSLNARTIDLHRKGDYAAATKAAEKAVQVAERDFGKDAVETATPINNLAALYRREGKYAEAEPLQKRALAMFEKALGADHPITAGCLNNLAILFWSQGRYAEAEQLCRRALAIREKALGPDHPDTVTNRQDLVRMQQERAAKDGP